MSIKSVLEELYRKGTERGLRQTFIEQIHLIDIDEAHQAILAEFERMLPPMKNPNILPQQRLSTPDEIIYNQAISNMHSKIMGIKPEKSKS